MTVVVLENAALLDGTVPERRGGHHVAFEGERIVEVSDRPISGAAERRIDLAGRTLMPGLIDAHVHVTVASVRIAAIAREPATLTGLRAGAIMAGMLARGFTTVRDAGGADWGLARAVEEGLLPGPRLFYSGRALSQTGGHGDFRPLTAGHCPCGSMAIEFSAVVDGVDAVRRAAREELRRGATQIKIMASGGVASPADPVWNLQFSEEEIAAAVWEARAWRTYVMAHAYTPEAVTRAVRLGVRSIEHGNLIDEATAAVMVEHGAYLVPTLVTYEALHRDGAALGLPAVSLAKLGDVRDRGLAAVEIAHRAGVPIGFGTDLLGQTHHYQSMELRLRAEVMSPHEVIRSATSVNAALLNRSGELGVIAPGALADLIAVDGNPLEDLGRLEAQGAHLPLVVQGGRFVKDTLT